MDSKERRQRKYLRQMLNKSMKNHKEFNTEMMKETHNKHMNDIKEKYSPNGGRKPFKVPLPYKKTDDR